ncbi:helix-hairpin-helix domain-containing protein [Laribacter hongkongensis]|uniref:Helix-hairpin-helix domain-containing protein n=1 Tax=Laribacter hongkongensis TaxID=168471 RepID=A0AAW5DJ36_9NEIS|nr:helix-hairpin-helix domain-containing protein [Laribacter hongkongensis]MBE5527701.1 competence protein ComE [Laribacter hongkongensis]MCG8991170.1 helix-hairpin-helix domain-containing protein [Laribacter hongkongensis]MCG8994603.1 helix-hairpin-helix domain-containing protein [Laribacter hongkongensis]MCG9002067.1 helix-hairpin-helix domain-containing protein [Laribacter hongkongensis]MCG9008117.1 helix-hairpin-helix domain-containing protein [Laribacter hongkongensis]
MKRLMMGLVAVLISTATMAAVDVNSATQAQLEDVKGLGPVKAKAIIDYRQKNGPFKTLDDLDKVEGFGRKSIDKLRAELSIGNRPVAATKAVAGKPVKP